MAVVIQPGQYLCRIEGQQLTTSSNGNLQLVFSVVVLGEIDPNDVENVIELPEDIRNRNRTIYRALTDRTMQRAADELKALGFTGASLEQFDPDHPEFCSLAGIECNCICKINDYNGNQSERWELDVLAGGAAAVPPAEKKLIKTVAASFNKFLKGGPAAPAPAAALTGESPKPRATKPRKEANIPF